MREGGGSSYLPLLLTPGLVAGGHVRRPSGHSNPCAFQPQEKCAHGSLWMNACCGFPM